jgi:hypothetical protein
VATRPGTEGVIWRPGRVVLAAALAIDVVVTAALVLFLGRSRTP